MANFDLSDLFLKRQLGQDEDLLSQWGSKAASRSKIGGALGGFLGKYALPGILGLIGGPLAGPALMAAAAAGSGIGSLIGGEIGEGAAGEAPKTQFLQGSKKELKDTISDQIGTSALMSGIGTVGTGISKGADAFQKEIYKPAEWIQNKFRPKFGHNYQGQPGTYIPPIASGGLGTPTTTSTTGLPVGIAHPSTVVTGGTGGGGLTTPNLPSTNVGIQTLPGGNITMPLGTQTTIPSGTSTTINLPTTPMLPDPVAFHPGNVAAGNQTGFETYADNMWGRYSKGLDEIYNPGGYYGLDTTSKDAIYTSEDMNQLLTGGLGEDNPYWEQMGERLGMSGAEARTQALGDLSWQNVTQDPLEQLLSQYGINKNMLGGMGGSMLQMFIQQMQQNQQNKQPGTI